MVVGLAIHRNPGPPGEPGLPEVVCTGPVQVPGGDARVEAPERVSRLTLG